MMATSCGSITCHMVKVCIAATPVSKMSTPRVYKALVSAMTGTMFALRQLLCFGEANSKLWQSANFCSDRDSVCLAMTWTRSALQQLHCIAGVKTSYQKALVSEVTIYSLQQVRFNEGVNSRLFAKILSLHRIDKANVCIAAILLH